MTRSCDEQAYLSELLDGELSEKKAMEIRAHLAACERCQRVFSELTRLDSMLKGLPDIELSEDFDKRFDGRLRSDALSLDYHRIIEWIKEFFKSGFRVRAAASVALILIMIMVIQHSLSSEPSLESGLL